MRRALGQSRPVGKALGPQSGLRLVDNPYLESGEAEGPGYSGKLKWKVTNGRWKVAQARNSKARRRRGRWCPALPKASVEWVILIFREALGDPV